MPNKFERFCAALHQLCTQHQVQLSTSMYDAIVVNDLKEGDMPIYMDNIEDHTKPEEPEE